MGGSDRTAGSSRARGVQFFRKGFVTSVRNGSVVRAWRFAGLRGGSRARVVQFFLWREGFEWEAATGLPGAPMREGGSFSGSFVTSVRNGSALRGTARELSCESGAVFLMERGFEGEAAAGLPGAPVRDGCSFSEGVL